MKTYTLVYDDYKEAFRTLRKLKKRNITLVYAVFVVKVEKHNRIIDLISQQKSKQVKIPLIVK